MLSLENSPHLHFGPHRPSGARGQVQCLLSPQHGEGARGERQINALDNPFRPTLPVIDMTSDPQLQPIDPRARFRLSSKARVRTDKITGKPALLYPEGVLLLNPTGAAIVELCDGQHTFTEMVTQLAERYSAPCDKLLLDVTEYLGRLRERGLVEPIPEKERSL